MATKFREAPPSDCKVMCCIENRGGGQHGVTIPCLYLHFISSLLGICFLFSSNPLLAFLLLSTSLYYYYSAFYYSALYYSAFSLFSSITQRHFY